MWKLWPQEKKLFGHQKGEEQVLTKLNNELLTRSKENTDDDEQGKDSLEKKDEEVGTKQTEDNLKSLPIKKLSKKELIEKNGGLGFPTKDEKV